MSLNTNVAYWDAQKVLHNCVKCDYYPLCWTISNVCYNEDMIRKVCKNSQVLDSIEIIKEVFE